MEVLQRAKLSPMLFTLAKAYIKEGNVSTNHVEVWLGTSISNGQDESMSQN